MKLQKVLIAMQAVHKNDILSKMTAEALGSIKCKHRWSALVDDRDVNLATKWNKALDIGVDFNVDYVILVNNDILFDKQCLDNLIEFHEKHSECLVTGPTQYFQNEKPQYSDKVDNQKLHWSFVMLNPKEMLDKIGYCETLLERGSFVDTEWQIRIDKKGYKVARTENSWFFHYNDTTHRLLPAYRNVFNDNHNIVKQKWGNNYEYDYPYNDKSLDIKYIGAYNEKEK